MSTKSVWTQLRHVLGGYPSTAAEWAVRAQSADVTREELLVLNAWLKADPRNAEDYARTSKIGHLGLKLREQRDELERLHGYQRLRAAERLKETPMPGHGALGWLAAGGACLVLATLAAFLWPRSGPGDRYVSGHGEQRKITLADGSRMVVNTDSEVTVRYDEAARVVELPRGEAFFEVARSARRPFIVRAGRLEVRAIGTKFSVSQGHGATTVVVTEGRVRVTRENGAPGDAKELAPGHELRAAPRAAALSVLPVDALRETAWTSGTVEFEDAPLERVVSELNRYTAKTFVIADPQLSSIRLSGRFRVGDMESVKFALRDRFGVAATEDGQQIRLSGGAT